MAQALEFQAYPAPAGPLEYARIPWDSDLMGFPCYELRCGQPVRPDLDPRLEAWLAELSAQGRCLVAARTPPGDVALNRLLTAHGFYLVETLIEFHIALQRFEPSFPEDRFRKTALRPLREGDLPRVIEIAATAFSADRFHLDPNVPPGAADRRYAHWVEQSATAGEPVSVLEDQQSGRVIGFVQTRVQVPGAIEMSLAAVETTALRSGAGVALYQAILLASKAQGYHTATARASVNNLDSIRLLVRFGFQPRRAVTTWHWFHGAGDRT
jgi:L-amino acid N-acyltransferase YncA